MKTRRIFVPAILMAALLLITLTANATEIWVESRYLNINGYSEDSPFEVTVSQQEAELHYVPFGYIPFVEPSVSFDVANSPWTSDGGVLYAFSDVYFWQGEAGYVKMFTHESSLYFLSATDDQLVIIYYTGGTFDISGLNSLADVELGESLDMSWTADSGVEQSAQVTIELTRNNGTTWEVIDDVVYNNGGSGFNGSYDWTATGSASAACKMRLTLFDYAGNEDVIQSNMFTITEPVTPPCETEHWTNMYEDFPGAAQAQGVQPMNDGGYLVASISYQDCDLHLWKVDDCGEVVWDNPCVNGSSPDLTHEQLVSGPEKRSARHQTPILERTTDDGFIALSNENGVKLIKLSSTGTVSWSTTINNIDHAYSVKQNSDLGYVVAAVDNGSGSDDIVLVRFNSIGNELWRKTMGGAAHEGYLWMDAKETSDGGFVVLSDYVDGSDKDWYLAKLSYGFNLQWDMRMSYTGNAYPCAVVEADDGNLVVGWSLYQYPLGDMKLTKVKADGSGIWWERTYGGSGRESVYSLLKIPTGGYIIGGTTTSFGLPDMDFYVIKTDPAGLVEWTETFNGLNTDFLYSAALVGTDGYIMSGKADESGYPIPALLVKAVIPCCVGIRGNIDGIGGIDISDLVSLVDYMFTGGSEPPCWSEANVDGIGPDDASGIDMPDLVYLVDYMLTGGPQPPSCP